MATKIIDLYQVQAGKESSDWGTAVAQTVKLMGVTECTITPEVSSKNLSDKRGSLAPAGESEIVSVGGGANMKGVASYEDTPYLFDALFGTATPTDDSDVDSDVHTYTYKAPGALYDTDLADPRVMTLAYGEDADATANSLAGATLTSLSLACEISDEMTYDANFLGKQVSADAMDTCSDREVNPIMGNHFALYIDPSTDAVGTTVVTTSFFAFTLSVDTHRTAVRHMGSQTPSGYRNAQWSGSLSLSLECTATAEAYQDALLLAASTLDKAVRLRATDSARIMTIDFFGTALESPDLHTARDGVVCVDMVLTGKFNVTAQKWLNASVVNAVSALA